MGDYPYPSRGKPYVLVPPFKHKRSGRPLSPPSSLDSLSRDSDILSYNGSSESAAKKGKRKMLYVEIPEHPSCKKRARRLSPPPKGPNVYVRSPDEVEETEDLVVFGETEESPSDEDDDDESAPEVPVRVLSDFCIYALPSMELVPATQLHDLSLMGGVLGASGLVRPWVEDDEDEDDDELSIPSLELGSHADSWDRVSLTAILKFDVHDIDENTNELNSKLYIQTKHAWYILDTPSRQYREHFATLWTRCRLAHLFFSVANDEPTLSFKSFRENIADHDDDIEGINATQDVIGRSLVPDDLDSDDVIGYLIECIDVLAHPMRVTRSALVRHFTNKAESSSSAHESESLGLIAAATSSTAGRSSPKKGSAKKKKKGMDSDIYITPIVSSLSEGLFQVPMQKLKSLSEESADEEMAVSKIEVIQHPFDPESVEWGTELRKNVYKDVYIDEAHYKVGDIVMVVRDENYDGVNDQGRTTSVYGENYWFAQICYFFEDPSKRGASAKQFHGQWLLHGSRVPIVGELSHPGELFLIDGCQDQSLSCIFQKANVRYLAVGEAEPANHLTPYDNDFFCRYSYDEDTSHITDLPEEYLQPPSKDPESCHGCWLAEQKIVAALPQVIAKNGFRYQGLVFHIGDFVYIIPPRNEKLLLVAQITEIHGDGHDMTINVHYLRRHVEDQPPFAMESIYESSPSAMFLDERKLFFSPDFEEIKPHRLSGVFWVQSLSAKEDIDEWVQDCIDHFYLDSEDDFECCEICLNARLKEVEERRQFVGGNEKLAAMELFCGAGGLGLGMSLSQAVETKWAVEYFDSAALTFQKNHPETKVYCQDTNLLLKCAVAVDNGENVPEVQSLCEDLPCPKMPSKKDGIDFILGGPPCQGFSRANHNRRPDDIRTSMPCNMLAYVEHYDPTYFQLENVMGFLDFELIDNREGGNGAVIKQGMLKFVMRILSALGYQTRWNILQAAQYGVPQSRHRIIIWGAKRGVTCPDFPVPTHAFQKGVQRPKIPGTSVRLPPPSRTLPGSEVYHQCAPHQPRGVLDAICDLRAFDWRLPSSKEDLRVDPDRKWFGKQIPVLNAVSSRRALSKDDRLVGYIDGREYAIPPINRYQEWLRAGMVDGKKSKVQGHYTPRFTTQVVERTVQVPLKPGATDRDLPKHLQGKKKIKYIRYGRVDGNRYFKCALTTMNPGAQNSWALHPLQKRTYTVRELARAQGFPDNYIFYSTKSSEVTKVKEQIKQIGNAVAVPFAFALGQELLTARMKDWRKRQRDVSPAY